MRCVINDCYEMFLEFPKRNRPLLEQCLNIAKEKYIEVYKSYVKRYYSGKEQLMRIQLLDYKYTIREINNFLDLISNPSFKKEEAEEILKEMKRMLG